MIFESGMHFDFDQARTVGPWACAVAFLGTFLPIIFGSLLAIGFGFDFFPDGLSVGVSLAPTSVGIALKLLHESKALQTYFGQAVMTAAFVDDVLSLVLFSVLFSLGGELTFMTFLPLVLGCIFMVVAVIACVTVWPHLLKWVFSRIPETKASSKLTRHDEIMWIIMFITLAAYAQITHMCGTHLWGCFIAGMSFSTDRNAHHVWSRQVKRLTYWFLRLFFACTLAWAIPIEELFSFDAFWKGTLMGIGPCVLTKVCCAPFMGSARWVIGWAMVGRAEFAYFIAINAKSLKMMEDKLFAILIWALIYATIFAPLIFRSVLKRYMLNLETEGGSGPKDISEAGMQPVRKTAFERELDETEVNKHTISELKQDLRAKDDEITRLKEALSSKKLSIMAEEVQMPNAIAEPIEPIWVLN